ncbi:group II truncated hemoglobin [Halioxenophilus sp. WMMB6]|uniref:group II truncated hemoglobin n=1 Tax=Halioxenophilus sp. WMMB6 TaxID=3073815 RepID=UPI00295E9390|nr:group II truncated hemoglobin [Halioxenophilus sp. WMMB6]
MSEVQTYGVGDATFRAVGGEAGVYRLVNAFYDIIASSPETEALHQMHNNDLTESRDKLFRFLSGWMGGPKLYRERYGPIDIINSHAHLPITDAGRDAWLWAMTKAIGQQHYPQDLADYLLKQLTVPADRILTRHQC